jgi:ribosomal-protein-serine acetyltransferase
MIDLDLGDGVRLRSLRVADAPAMFARIEADRAHLDRWLRWTPMLRSADDVARFLAGFEALEARSEGFHLGLFVGEVLAGGVVCWTIHPTHRSSEIGYWLGAAHLGHGLATRAAAAVVAHLFAELGVHRIEMLCALGNARSRAVPERLGFRLESVRRGSHRIGGEFRDHVVYARLATDPAPAPGGPGRASRGPLLAPVEFEALLARLAEGWARRDYAAVAREFAEGVHYADPTRYAFTGRSALKAFFEHDEGQPQRVAWHSAVFDPARQVGAAEYTYEGSRRYHGAVFVRVEGGLITHWREHQHVDPREWADFVGGTAFP